MTHQGIQPTIGGFARRLTAASTLVLAALVLVPPIAGARAPAQAAPLRYVALGDSYSSGEGTANFTESTSGPDGCHRSPIAWPVRVATDLQTDYEFDAEHDFLACSGALTQDIYSPRYKLVRETVPAATYEKRIADLGCDTSTLEVSDVAIGPRFPRPGKTFACRVQTGLPQIDVLGPDVGLVTLTIGGNNAGFADAVERCLLDGLFGRDPRSLRPCRDDKMLSFLTGDGDTNGIYDDDAVERRVLHPDTARDFTAELVHTYGTVLDHAPAARLVVVGYPAVVHTTNCGLFDDDSFKWMTTTFDVLNARIAVAVDRAQAAHPDRQIEFVPLPRHDPNWKDRGICSNPDDDVRHFPSDELINRLMVGRAFDKRSNTFHPNDKGQVAIAGMVGPQLSGRGGALVDQLRLPPSSNVDVVLAIDTSGSMGSNDQQHRRVDAARLFLEVALGEDQVGVVSFNSTATVLSELRPVAGNKAKIRLALAQIGSSGQTDIGAGLQRACDQLTSRGRAPRRAVILFTDGRNEPNPYGGQDRCLAERGWPVYAFGLGSADDALLSGIASRTGGTYERLPSAEALPCEMQGTRAALSGVPAPPCTSTLVRQGETQDRMVEVAQRQLLASFTTMWPGSDVVTTLVTPSGRTIDRSTLAADVRHERTETTESFAVAYPEPGQWTIQVFGADVGDAGEVVTTGFATVARPAAPTASATVSTTAGTTQLPITFDASASTSPNGRLAVFEWWFGDSSSPAYGRVVDHTYAYAGTFTPRLRVVDDVGEDHTIDLPPITVVGDPLSRLAPLAVSRAEPLDADAWTTFGGAAISGNGSTFTINGTDAPWSGAIANPEHQCDYRVSGDARIIDAAGVGLAARAWWFPDEETLIGRSLQYDPGAGGLRDVDYPSDSGPTSFRPTDSEWHRLTIDVEGDRYRMYVDDELVFSGTTPDICGGVALRVWAGSAELRDVVVSDLPRSVYNVLVDPRDWDTSDAAWDRYGPTFEENPDIVPLGATHAHAFGADTGQLAYAVELPPLTLDKAIVSARLSSEWAFFDAPPEAVSEVTLFVNGQAQGSQTVVADDGTGQDYQWSVDPRSLQPGTNHIAFAVLPTGQNRNGLCIYGRSLVAGVPDAAIQILLRLA